jgi:KDO2-lipid IV(A) lauroyltransferase
VINPAINSNPVAKKEKQSTPLKLWHPKYWPTWLLLGILWLITRLPLKANLAIARQFGRCLYYFAPRRRRITETNIRLCFPELGETERTALVKNIFIENARGFVEALFGWWNKEKRLKPLVEFHGLENLEAAKSRGNGVIILGMHLTTLDLAGTFFNLFEDADVIYRRQKNPVFDFVIRHGREKNFKHVIDRADTRRIFKNLKQGRMIWYAPDQDYGRKVSVFAPFFGIPAASITATARLAKLNDSPILVFTHYRKEDNSGYVLNMSKPLENYPTGDDVADATRINSIIEESIRVRPEQYMWTHRRFKTRPEGEPGKYDN